MKEVLCGGSVYTLNIETSPDAKKFKTWAGFSKCKKNSAFTSLRTSPNRSWQISSISNLDSHRTGYESRAESSIQEAIK